MCTSREYGTSIPPFSCTASLVLFKTPLQMLREVLQSFPPYVFITIVDNSPIPVLQPVVSNMPMVAYHHAGQNLGYGKAHNLALKLSPPSDFHLIVNPDIIAEPTVIDKLLSFMGQHTDIGMVGPRFLYGDGSLQYLNRRSPTVLDIILRRLPDSLLTRRMRQRMSHHEMSDMNHHECHEVESLSGAFMLCRRTILELAGGFDSRYFMYFEDFDLCFTFRLLGFRTVCYPVVSVTHLWTRSSSKEICMTLIHIRSMIIFFNKWGWRWY